jgi:hypothetical protein
MAAAGAVEAVTFETASGAPWTWSCASCPPDGCAVTAPSNAGSASSASTPPLLVGTVPAALGDLWCIGRITSMCVCSRRAVAFCAAHRKCRFLQGPERAELHRPVARHHHAAAPTLIDVRPRRLVLKSRTPKRSPPQPPLRVRSRCQGCRQSTPSRTPMRAECLFLGASFGAGGATGTSHGMRSRAGSPPLFPRCHPSPICMSPMPPCPVCFCRLCFALLVARQVVWREPPHRAASRQHLADTDIARAVRRLSAVAWVFEVQARLFAGTSRSTCSWAMFPRLQG